MREFAGGAGEVELVTQGSGPSVVFAIRLGTLTPACPFMEVPGELRVPITRHEMDKV